MHFAPFRCTHTKVKSFILWWSEIAIFDVLPILAQQWRFRFQKRQSLSRSTIGGHDQIIVQTHDPLYNHQLSLFCLPGFTYLQNGRRGRTEAHGHHIEIQIRIHNTDTNTTQNTDRNIAWAHLSAGCEWVVHAPKWRAQVHSASLPRVPPNRTAQLANVSP